MNIAVSIDQEPQPALVLTKAVLSVVERLGINAKQLATIIGCSEAGVSRLKKGRSIDPESKEGELSLLLIRLYRSLNAILGGNDEQSEKWLKAYNNHLNAVPVERINSIEGLIDVVQYLDAMRGRI